MYRRGRSVDPSEPQARYDQEAHSFSIFGDGTKDGKLAFEISLGVDQVLLSICLLAIFGVVTCVLVAVGLWRFFP